MAESVDALSSDGSIFNVRVRVSLATPLRNNCVDTVEILKTNTFSLFLGNFARVQYSLVVGLPIFYLL